MGFELTGQNWSIDEFKDYLSDVNLSWANSVTVHHTASPNLKNRPNGWQERHLKNLQHYYEKQLGWSSGPHLFTDEKRIWGLSSLYRRGVHAVSFNKDSLSIEMLGNYDLESPHVGRGHNVIELTAKTVALILQRMNNEASNETIKFHRDDPKTNKSCPGNLLEKKVFVSLVKSYMSNTNLTIEQRLTLIEKKLRMI